jgi:hypothetical protein
LIGASITLAHWEFYVVMRGIPHEILPAPKELADWYADEIAKRGLQRTDAPAIFWDDRPPIRRCRYVPLPDGKTREQLEEILRVLDAQMTSEASGMLSLSSRHLV